VDLVYFWRRHGASGGCAHHTCTQI
jgi:hypothetical protein